MSQFGLELIFYDQNDDAGQPDDDGVREPQSD